MIFVNFKTYKQSSGKKAIILAKTLNEISKESKISIVSCVQEVDLEEVVKASDSPIWAQNVDPGKRGRATGWFPPEVAKEMGAQGTLLNHSEHKLTTGVLGETLAGCKELGLKTLVFADNPEEARMVAEFEPDFIGYEPPELVGSKETSVAKAKPEVIKDVVKAIPEIPIIVGAGVKSESDVATSLELGAKGVALSSAVVLAKNPRQVMRELIKGYNK